MNPNSAIESDFSTPFSLIGRSSEQKLTGYIRVKGHCTSNEPNSLLHEILPKHQIVCLSTQKPMDIPLKQSQYWTQSK